MKIIDAHTHIDYISTEYQSGVVGCICCSKCESEWDELLDVTDNENVYGAFGIHPWNVSDIKDGFDKRLYEILKTKSLRLPRRVFTRGSPCASTKITTT